MGDSPAAAAQQHEALEAQILQTVEAEAAMLEQQVQALPTADGAQLQEEQQRADEDCSMGSDDDAADVSMDAAAADTAAMELASGSPVAAACPPTSATPAGTPAASTAASPGVTSPGARYRSASAKTSAPPKSALARPRSGSTSTKHAHVVVPEASSPKATPPAKTATGDSLRSNLHPCTCPEPCSACDRLSSGWCRQIHARPGNPAGSHCICSCGSSCMVHNSTLNQAAAAACLLCWPCRPQGSRLCTPH